MTTIRTEPPKKKPLKPGQTRRLVLSFQLPDPRHPGRTVRVTKGLGLVANRDNEIIANQIRREVEAQLALGHFDAVIARFPTSRRLKRLGLLAAPVAQKPTLGALCTEWLEQRRRQGRAKATLATYTHLLKRVLGDALAGQQADLVTVADIEGLIERLASEGPWRGASRQLSGLSSGPSGAPTFAARRSGGDSVDALHATPPPVERAAIALSGRVRQARPPIPAGQINRIVWILSSAYAMGEKRYELTRNPARLVERMDAAHKRATDPFSADEVKRILEAANGRNSRATVNRHELERAGGTPRRAGNRPDGVHLQIYNLIVVAIGTGMRVGELFGLRWQAVNFDGNYIDVIETHGRYGANKPKTAGSRRRLDMSASVRAALNAQRAISLRRTLGAANGKRQGIGHRVSPRDSDVDRRPFPLPDQQSLGRASIRRENAEGPIRQISNLDTEIVFPSRALTPMDHNNFSDRAWPELLERAGVPYRPFGKCRHTFAVLMREQMGAQDRDIARQLGHTTLDMMINHYLRWSPDRQGKAADVIAELDRPRQKRAKS